MTVSGDTMCNSDISADMLACLDYSQSTVVKRRRTPENGKPTLAILHCSCKPSHHLTTHVLVAAGMGRRPTHCATKTSHGTLALSRQHPAWPAHFGSSDQ